jgi:hypothetical protein
MRKKIEILGWVVLGIITAVSIFFVTNPVLVIKLITNE